jgi:uncharacterized protein YceK
LLEKESVVNNRFAVVLALVAVAGMLAGCATVQTATRFNGQQVTEANATPVAHVNAKNWGIYLLSIPLITGDPETGVPTVLKDTVNVDTAVHMVTAESQQLDATRTTDITSSRQSIWIAPFLVLFYQSVQASGNATR